MLENNLKLADEFAQEYDKSVLNNGWIGPELIFNSVKDLLQPNSNILDLGIGTGESSWRFQQAGHVVTGLDGSKNMIAECKKKGIGNEWFVHDIEKGPLPFNNFGFDAVISNGVFHLIHPVSNVFCEASRILRDKGIFAFTFEEAKNTSQFTEIEPGVWKHTTQSKVVILKHDLNYINSQLLKFGFSLFQKEQFLAFTNKKSKTEFYFTAVIAQKQE